MEDVDGETPEQTRKRHVQQATSWKPYVHFFFFGDLQNPQNVWVWKQKK